MKREDGFTLMETIFANLFLAVAMAGIAMAITAALNRSELLHEYELAEATALSVVEEVQYLADASFSNLYAYFDDDPANEPGGGRDGIGQHLRRPLGSGACRLHDLPDGAVGRDPRAHRRDRGERPPGPSPGPERRRG